MQPHNSQLIGQGIGRRSQVTEQQRLMAVDDARFMYHKDVMISRSVKIMTDFGFGQRVQITPRDGALAQRWADFWSAPANDYVLNEREIGHMIDVKNVADGMKRVAYVAGAIVGIGLALLLVPRATRYYGWRTLFYAGLATVIALAAIALAILVAWPIFFTQFHELLFPPETWTFAYSDSLIRLFPEQFWFDIGVLVSVGTLALGALVALAGYILSRRSS